MPKGSSPRPEPSLTYAPVWTDSDILRAGAIENPRGNPKKTPFLSGGGNTNER